MKRLLAAAQRPPKVHSARLHICPCLSLSQAHPRFVLGRALHVILGKGKKQRFCALQFSWGSL